MTETAALVISLDLELHWGVRDHVRPDSSYWKNLEGARDAVAGMLDLFQKYEVAATWAIVGMLFASTRDQRESFSPDLRPSYLNAKLDPYSETIGWCEADDPLHFGLTLVEQIRATPRQEIASHTFSHYYCLEHGQTPEQFFQDLLAAKAIARHNNLALESLVLPRNQCNQDYLSLIREAGFLTYRGHEDHFAYDPSWRKSILVKRGFRFLDSFLNLSGEHVSKWPVPSEGLPINIPSSRFLRPLGKYTFLNRLAKKRILGGIQYAARSGGIYHLWWHPHNFGRDTQRNLDALGEILQTFNEYRRQFSIRSMTMKEVGEEAQARSLQARIGLSIQR